MTPKEKHALLNQMGFVAEQMQELTEKLGNYALAHESYMDPAVLQAVNYHF